MATPEVLRPQDRFAADRFRETPSFHRRRNLHQLPNLIVNKRPYNNYGPKKASISPKPDNRRKDGSGSRKTSPSPSPSSSPPPTHVTLLRRGESLDSLTKGSGFNKNNNNNLNNRSSKSPEHKTHYHHDDHSKKLKDHQQKSRSRGYKSCDDVAICATTGRIGPESPEMCPKQIKLLPSSSRDVYAGSAFSLSPSPRSLPLPSFFGNNSKVGNCGNDDDDRDGDPKANIFEESATNGLRRLLRLD